MQGLYTPLDWLARPYLQPIETNFFEANLGNTTLGLSLDEAIELCDCIDDVCGKYKQIMVDAGDILQTWNFDPVLQENDYYGFKIMGVKVSVWHLMCKFANEFDNKNGSSVWHLFEPRFNAIQITRNWVDHAFLIPYVDPHFPFAEDVYLDLIYIADDLHLRGGLSNKQNWKDRIGEFGIWTAEKTKNWVKNEFIPKVIKYYNVGRISDPFWSDESTPLDVVSNCKQLAQYVHKISTWLMHKRSVKAELIVPYYYSFLALIENATVSSGDLDYMLGKLSTLDKDIYFQESRRSFKEAFRLIREHTNSVAEIGYDHGGDASYISAVFINVLETGEINFDQFHFNNTKKALKRILQECLFESRHVFM